MSNEVIISPIFQMGNKRKLINKGLIDLFPKDINTFYDLFSGSGVVSMNTKAKKYVVNDINSVLYRLYRAFKFELSTIIIQQINRNIEKFGLIRQGVKQNTEEAKRYKPCYVALRKYANITRNIIDIYTCMFYASSQQMRFNKKGDFNMPFGNGAFTKDNESYIENGCKFFSQLNVQINNNHFPIQWGEKNGDFVYLDPPYLGTTATYNENNGWNIESEKELHNYCERLNSLNIKFALSNYFRNKGIDNIQLKEWVQKNNFNVHYFDGMTYSACGKGNANTQEVLITNYI